MAWKEGLMMSQNLAASEIVQKLKAEISGATVIEYALLAGGIALAIIASVGLIGDELAALFDALLGDARCLEVGSNCKK